MNPLKNSIRRLPVTLTPNPKRVLLRPFIPSLVVKPTGDIKVGERIPNLFARVMMLDKNRVKKELGRVLHDFGKRHLHIENTFRHHFEKVRGMLPTDRLLSPDQELLLGAYFTNEYSLESAALFNPSIVPHPDQTNIPEGALRFVLSLRATGEGHISSIAFRSGIITKNADVVLEPLSRYVRQPRLLQDTQYQRDLFLRKLYEVGVSMERGNEVLNGIPEKFSDADLQQRIQKVYANHIDPLLLEAADHALALARANYSIKYTDDADLSEKIIFPFAPSESNGIEDARFVRFVEEDGSACYYATYTAYNGNTTFPQMVETRDFNHFDICTLNGPAVCNKGLALFPRRINGRYAMLGRQDSENIHLMFSEHPHFWYRSTVILRPAEPWEFVQLGNCGSPIETESGWLVLTHGVGPMRRYAIGAALLDLENPEHVIGRLKEPLLMPAGNEREGYVPNVVYSCGSIIHAGHLILPYAISDSASRFATVPLADLLNAMQT